MKALENMFQKLDCVQTLISNLEWPEPDFRKHLEIRISRLAADTIESFGKRYLCFLFVIGIQYMLDGL